MKKKFLVVGSLACLVGVVFFPQIRLALLAGLFIWDLLGESGSVAPGRGSLSWVNPMPVLKHIEIPRGQQSIAADLYYPPDRQKHAAIVLTHGVIETGKNDPRLVRFAYSLAHSGFVVLVPDLKGMKSFRIVLSDVDDIVASFLWLSEAGEVDKGKMGMLGFSYGAGPTLMAAAHPRVSGQVRFLVSFGGYFDPVNVIRYITTGYYGYGADQGYLKPEPYGKWVFFMNNLDYVENAQDRTLLRELFKKEEANKKEDVARLLEKLTPRGRYLYQLLVNQDPHRVESLLKRIDPKVRSYLNRLSLAPVVPKLQAYLLIGHGNTDSLIPYTESLRLADAAPDKTRVHMVIVKLFAHVDPAQKSYSTGELLTVYVPSLLRFYLLVYDLLGQQY